MIIKIEYQSDNNINLDKTMYLFLLYKFKYVIVNVGVIIETKTTMVYIFKNNYLTMLVDDIKKDLFTINQSYHNHWNENDAHVIITATAGKKEVISLLIEMRDYSFDFNKNSQLTIFDYKNYYKLCSFNDCPTYKYVHNLQLFIPTLFQPSLSPISLKDDTFFKNKTRNYLSFNYSNDFANHVTEIFTEILEKLIDRHENVTVHFSAMSLNEIIVSLFENNNICGLDKIEFIKYLISNPIDDISEKTKIFYSFKVYDKYLVIFTNI